MKARSSFLLFIFVLSLIPFNLVHAEQDVTRDVEDALAFLYVSDSILLNEVIDDQTSSVNKRTASIQPEPNLDPTEDLYNHMINAVKKQRNDHDQKCRETEEIYRQQKKDCELNQTKAYCEAKRSVLTAKIAQLREKRGGDKRKWFTKQWHGLKRAGAKFWHRIGPLGRNFLREVGPAALKIVQAGGPGTEALLKNLLKHTAKKMARERMKQIGIRALQRILKVQLEVSAAAGIDICKDDEEDGAEASDDKQQENQTSEEFNLPTSGVWDLTCQHTHENIIEEYPDVAWKLKITWETLFFDGTIDGTSTIIEDNETTSWVWHEEGVGEVTPDGFLWGDAAYTTKYSHAYGSNKPFVEERVYNGKWLGAISEDLDKVCLFRVGAQQIDLDWLRERGRQEMLDHPGGLCEGLCTVK
jgi:hypothetical protein